MFADFLGNVGAAIVYGPRPPSDPASSTYFGGNEQSLAGTPINEWTALNLPAYWRGVRIISETLGSLPTTLYKRISNGGKEKAVKHPCYRLMATAPNPEQTAMVWQETGQAHVLTWGNKYSEIERSNVNRPLAVWPITPNRVLPDREGDGPLEYRVTFGGGQKKTVPAEDMIHVPGLGFDGMVGYSVVRMMQESLGLTMATERFGAGFFGNGSRPGGVLRHPGKLKQTAQDNLRNSWERMHQGPYKAGRVAILQEGMEWQTIGVPPEDAQYLGTRAFQTLDLARILGLPPHLLYDLSRATFSNIEHLGIEFVTYTLRAWAVRWEQELNRKLLTEAEQEDYFFLTDFNELQRGDKQSRYAAHAVAKQWGWENTNEIREEEGMNPIGPEGDIYLVPVNMTTLEMMLAGPEPPAAGGTEVKPGEPNGTKEKPFENGKPKAPAPSAAVLAAHRAVLTEGLARLTRKECQAARRASKEPSRFLAWLDEFYPGHESLMTANLAAPVRMHLALAGGDGSGAVAEAGKLAKGYCDSSKVELLELSGVCTATNLAERVGLVCDRWELERPTEVAAQFFRLQ